MEEKDLNKNCKDTKNYLHHFFHPMIFQFIATILTAHPINTGDTLFYQNSSFNQVTSMPLTSLQRMQYLLLDLSNSDIDNSASLNSFDLIGLLLLEDFERIFEKVPDSQLPILKACKKFYSSYKKLESLRELQNTPSWFSRVSPYLFTDNIFFDFLGRLRNELSPIKMEQLGWFSWLVSDKKNSCISCL